MMADGDEPRPDLADDVVDLERLQERWLFFQLGTPGGQESLPAGFLWLPIGFIRNLRNRWFPLLHIHRLFLCNFGARQQGSPVCYRLFEGQRQSLTGFSAAESRLFCRRIGNVAFDRGFLSSLHVGKERSSFVCAKGLAPLASFRVGASESHQTLHCAIQLAGETARLRSSFSARMPILPIFRQGTYVRHPRKKDAQWAL